MNWDQRQAELVNACNAANDALGFDGFHPSAEWAALNARVEELVAAMVRDYPPDPHPLPTTQDFCGVEQEQS